MYAHTPSYDRAYSCFRSGTTYTTKATFVLIWNEAYPVRGHSCLWLKTHATSTVQQLLNTSHTWLHAYIHTYIQYIHTYIHMYTCYALWKRGNCHNIVKRSNLWLMSIWLTVTSALLSLPNKGSGVDSHKSTFCAESKQYNGQPATFQGNKKIKYTWSGVIEVISHGWPPIVTLISSCTTESRFCA